jgi:hypothetical protein
MTKELRILNGKMLKAEGFGYYSSSDLGLRIEPLLTDYLLTNNG